MKLNPEHVVSHLVNELLLVALVGGWRRIVRVPPILDYVCPDAVTVQLERAHP